MRVLIIVLFVLLMICAVAVSFSKNLLNSILIYMSFSLIMSMVWMALESPDLAITEAAVGAGVTTLLFFGCFKKIGAIKDEEIDAEKELEVDTVHGYQTYYVSDLMLYLEEETGEDFSHEQEKI
ncbi:MAG: DUF4040 domain-containing protein [Lachnospiraceae bacterium]|nr:DUF4040 domain-containing protein [Lachnospiraceae bacterium]